MENERNWIAFPGFPGNIVGTCVFLQIYGTLQVSYQGSENTNKPFLAYSVEGLS